MERRVILKSIFIKLRNLWSKNVLRIDSDINMQFIIASKKLCDFLPIEIKLIVVKPKAYSYTDTVTESVHKTVGLK